jgi:predicted transcriptional regulator
MTGEVNSARIIVALPVKLREQVEQLAQTNEVSLAAITRRALRQFVGKKCSKPTK